MASMNVTLTVPDGMAVDVLETVTDEKGVETPNPQTRKAYLDWCVKEYVRAAWRSGKAKAADAHRLAAIAAADAISITN